MNDNFITNESHSKEDRISRLPDEILCQILSFLPTKYAVATGILSSRWKFVWTSLSNLSFDVSLCSRRALDVKINGYSDIPNLRFENFVNRVILLTDPRAVGKFSLNCWKLSDLSRFKFWVNSIIMRDVREIKLYLMCHESVELPESIFNSVTLEVLKLDSDFTIQIPPSGMCFPSLKVLSVVLQYPDNNLTERLFSSCAALEDLSISANVYDDDSVINFNISSTTLKKLSLALINEGYLGYNEQNVMIRAPSLELLKIQDNTSASYMFHELHSLTKVFVDFICLRRSRDKAGRAIQLLNGLTKAKFLSLSSGTISAIDYAYENFFPTFPYLTCLGVEVGGACGWRVLPIILSSSPNLEAFVFQEEGYDYFGYLTDAEEEPGWIEPLSVPQCLLLHVKKIEVGKFAGNEDEMGLVKYLLKNSEVLNTMIIKWRGSDEKEQLCQEILKFERGSKTCEVEFL